MKVAIIGGKLQGIEAVYLAKDAGYESILIDHNPKAPASGFCDRFVCGDIIAREEAVISALKEADFVLPANENEQVLQAIKEICEEEGLKLAFDFAAYDISSSKRLSDQLFAEHGIPCPLHYPEGKAPYIIKPSGESGSVGVTYAETEEAVEAFYLAHPDKENWIVQEYLQGDSYSIEVIGNQEAYRTYAITQIHMDNKYDCCKVTSPCNISSEQKEAFAEIGKKIASLIHLQGIMDVEVIDDDGQLKVLEIDARIPSQTPITVLYSSGDNLLVQLAEITLFGKFLTKQQGKSQPTAYEHYRRFHGEIIQDGEHVMGEAKPLHLKQGWCGSDVVITDYVQDQDDFRGIFVNWADTEDALLTKREEVVRQLKLLP
ncbi:pyrrolysine biosynthesis protein PylC [Clostridiales Family XIII bacterium PM5-7]